MSVSAQVVDGVLQQKVNGTDEKRHQKQRIHPLWIKMHFYSFWLHR